MNALTNLARARMSRRGRRTKPSSARTNVPLANAARTGGRDAGSAKSNLNDRYRNLPRKTVDSSLEAIEDRFAKLDNENREKRLSSSMLRKAREKQIRKRAR